MHTGWVEMHSDPKHSTSFLPANLNHDNHYWFSDKMSPVANLCTRNCVNIIFKTTGMDYTEVTWSRVLALCESDNSAVGTTFFKKCQKHDKLMPTTKL